jgi:O-antigen ligase
MNRIGGFVDRLEVAPASIVAVGVVAGFTLALAAVIRLGLPIWSLVLILLAGVYLIAVLTRPVIGLLAVVCAFFIPARFFEMISLLQLVGTVTAALLVVWFLYQRRTIYLGNVLLPLFLLGVMVLISLWYTRDAAATLNTFRKWIFNISFAILMINMVTRFDIFKKIVWTVIILAALNSLLGIFDFALSAEDFHRSAGLMADANSLGHFAALAFPLTLYQYLYRKGFLRWVGLALSMLFIAGISVSVSRGATISLILVFLTILVKERRKIIPLIMVILLFLCTLPFLPDYYYERMGNLGSDVKRTVGIRTNDDPTPRGYLMKAGLKMWLDNPVLGVGARNFGLYYVEREYNPGLKKSNRVIAHNIYIQALAEMGTVGAVILLWLILATLRNIVQARRASDRDSDQWHYFGSIEMMALAIFVSTATYGSYMWSDFWLLITLVAVSKRVALTEQEVESQQRMLPAISAG